MQQQDLKQCFGDVAIAVNPSDERYKKYIGKMAILPLVGRRIPVIKDPFVEKDFGTGAVKITPAHDAFDYRVGIQNNLEQIEVFGKDKKMYNILPKYEGMDIFEARKAIVNDLKKEGYLIKEEKYNHSVARCSRCNSIIEPLITDQYFVKMKELSKKAIEEVKNGDIEFIPKRFEKNYLNWMENIEDWCISRQLWWGHRIPVYTCESCGNVFVSSKENLKCSKCGEKEKLNQEQDTLDTWFSSSLWPFSILDWPEENDNLARFFPNDVMITAFDIIAFWVARMIYMSIYLTKKNPFPKILIHRTCT